MEMDPNMEDEEAMSEVEDNFKQPYLPSTSNDASKPKRKKAKGRNGNIYIGVTNRIEWFRLQEKFGFDNVNSFGNFVMNYMDKVHSDFDILHKMTVSTGLFDENDLAGFAWVNGVPHPVDSTNKFITLPTVELTDEIAEQGFRIAYDLAIERSRYLLQLSESLAQNPTPGFSFSLPAEVKTEPKEETCPSLEIADADDIDGIGMSPWEWYEDMKSQEQEESKIEEEDAQEFINSSLMEDLISSESESCNL